MRVRKRSRRAADLEDIREEINQDIKDLQAHEHEVEDAPPALEVASRSEQSVSNHLDQHFTEEEAQECLSKRAHFALNL